jgi:hypothetical protein
MEYNMIQIIQIIVTLTETNISIIESMAHASSL